MMRLVALVAATAPSARRAAARAASSCAVEPRASVDLLKFRGLAGAPPILPDALRGRAVLVVNTASHCGYTPQLASLQALHVRFAARGLVVLGVPSNDFGAQEPDAEPVVREFYERAHGVRFALTAKTAVTGGEAHAFYLHLQHKLGDAGAPAWNFMKYLLGRGGDVVALFEPSIDPLDAAVVEAVEAALAQPAPPDASAAPPRDEL
jgi:glutathione peroxidase